MKRSFALPLLLLATFAAPLVAQEPAGSTATDLLRRAQAFYERGSFEEARKLYERADALDLDPGPARYVDFRLADTSWRSAAASSDPDSSRIDAARAELEELFATYEHAAERDELWADLHESLGDLAWSRRDRADWGGAWGHYQQALDWWAGSREIDRARERYLGIVRRALVPAWWGDRSWDSWNNRVDVAVLERARRIAVAPEDRGWTGFFLGFAYHRYGGSVERQALALETFAEVLALGRESEWYDDALYHTGLFQEERGELVYHAGGGAGWFPDYVAAVEVYRRLVTEHRKGETRYYDDATKRIQRITAVEVAVGVDRFFVPGSELQLRLRWRNVAAVELLLYPIDLTRDVRPHDGSNDSIGDFAARIELGRTAPVQRWTHATGDEGDHRPGQAEILAPEKPARGAYVLVARGGGEESRELVLVGDALLSTKQAGAGLLGWFTDLETGAPIPEASVFLWERYRHGSRWRTRTLEGVTGADGTVFFDGMADARNAEFYLAARLGDRQAFATGEAWFPQAHGGNWRVYAHSDRPAYRPGDEVGWKVVARVDDPGGYRTPADEDVTWKVIDPRGATVNEGRATLNAYGSAWGSHTTAAEHPLGVYQVQLWRGSDLVATTQLFRLEEYKLPEFEVSVSLPQDEDGRARLFRLGDTVEAVIAADYYFGGAVGGAEVEVLVYQRPYHHAWPLDHEYPWLYGENDAWRGWYGGPGQLVQQETLHADEHGRVTLPIDTPRGSSEDLEYTIEARVVDSSRRQVVAQQTLRVTRQAYFVRVEPAHRLHAPGDRVELDFEARDANGNPTRAAGEVVVTRNTWVEVWRTPAGEEVRGRALDALRERLAVFPPPGEPGWVQTFHGYERAEVARTNVRIGPDGTARWTFEAPSEGYYTAEWTSTDDREQRVHASATFWVCDASTQDLGYRQGGIEILVDKDTFRTGERAAVMLSVPADDRWVLFTVEGEDLKHHEVVHVTGTVKLVTFDVTDAHVPNVWLGALTIFDRQVWWDTEEIVVPPEKSFLDVEVALDRSAYEPGDGGTATVTVRDHQGNPVQGEVSLAIYDAALAYVQGDLAGDPRQFFYGERDPQVVHTATTLNHRRFAKVVRREDGAVGEDEQARWDDRDGGESKKERLEALGYGGGVADQAAGDFLLKGDARQNLRASAAVRAPAAEADAAGGQLGMLGEQVAPDLGAVQVRTDFRDTAVWAAAVVADADGRAVIEVPFPESTTRWTAVARVADTGARVGTAESSVRTRQPLIARLQAPRFFTVGDEVTLSGNLSNQTEAALVVHAVLEAEGLELLGRIDGAELLPPQAGPLSIPAGGQARVDWRVRVARAGDVVLRLQAASPEHADGMERRLVAHPHGVEVFLGRSGRMTGPELALALDLPARAGAASLEVQLTPSLAVTMLDALPYLVDYPYGCTEQTLSRFVPTVVAARTFRELGLSPENALDRVYGGVEREHVEHTMRAVAGVERLDEAVAQGLDRLVGFQHADGGWAWWKDGESDHWMTAYVVWGLTLAQEAGVDVRADVLDRGRRFLEEEIVEAELSGDLQAWMLFALAARLRHDEATSKNATRAFENLYAKRSGLNAYTRALLALAAHDLGRAAEADVLVENLANGVIRDESPDTSVVMVGAQQGRDDALKTAHWGEDGVWYRWSEGGVEATAFVLNALLTIAPDHELVQPTVNWLLQNRRAGQWSNTRDTAMCVLALAKHLEVSGELGADVAYELFVNGERVARQELAPDALLTAPSRFTIDPALLRDGANEVRVVQTAGSPLYFATYARFFSAEEPIPARGHQVFVRREYYRLKPIPTLLKGVVYEKERLADGSQVASGDRIEVVLTAEAKNHLEYLVFEDLKPAGFEAVQVRSGERMLARELKASEVERRFVEDGRREEVRIPSLGAGYAWQVEDGYTGRTQYLHQELRDRHVALFVDRMPQGTWEMRYELRAETPGEFHALPVLGHAMYVPEIRCNSNEMRVEVTDGGAMR